MPAVAGVQISGVHVAMAVGGIVLAYAGLRDVNPLAALRDITSGKPPPVEPTTAGLSLTTTLSSVTETGVGAAAAGAVAAGTVGGRLVAAASKYRGDQYSQGRRWQPGWSDCSSFVGKAFKDIGITPPGASVAASYLTWSKLRRVDRPQLAAGDLCVNTGHIIMATGRDTAIGQQNERDDVQVGTPEGLMWGTGTFVCLRYVGGP